MPDEAAGAHHPDAGEDADEELVEPPARHREERSTGEPCVGEGALGLEDGPVGRERPAARDERPRRERDEPAGEDRAAAVELDLATEQRRRGEHDTGRDEQRAPGARVVPAVRPPEGHEERRRDEDRERACGQRRPP